MLKYGTIIIEAVPYIHTIHIYTNIYTQYTYRSWHTVNVYIAIGVVMVAVVTVIIVVIVVVD